MMKLSTGDALSAREMRRYPAEIDLLPYRGSAPAAEARRGTTFPEISAEIQKPITELSEAPTPPSIRPFALWEKEGVSFGDFIDIINPLQHIPIVATVYRNWSGDQIGAAPRVIGGALWGRLGGFVSGIVNAVVEWWSGKDIGDHIYAAIFGPSHKETEATAVAQNSAPSVMRPARDAGGEETISIERTPIAAEADVQSSERQRLLEMSNLSMPAHVASVYNKNNFAWNAARQHHRIRSV